MAVVGAALPADVTEDDTGGIPVSGESAPAGSLVDGVGQVQYGQMLIGVAPTYWDKLTGWRSAPGVDITDAAIPSGTGELPGRIYAQGVTVTFDFLVGADRHADRIAALKTIDQHTRVDGVARPLVIDDGAGPELRMARVIAREIPQDQSFTLVSTPVSVQFKCADPRRYSLRSASLRIEMPSTSGGLDYDPGLAYDPGLDYGTTTTGRRTATNDGNADAPIVATFSGCDFVKPRLRIGDRRVTFDLTLTSGDRMVVDSKARTVTLNGAADRSQTITDDSDLLEDLAIPPGESTVTLSAQSGDGYVSVGWHHATM